MDLNKIIEDAIVNNINGDAFSIAYDLLKDLDAEYLKTAEASDIINDYLIYDDDQWALLKAYRRPVNANWDEVINEFWNELDWTLGEIKDKIQEYEQQ